MHYEQHSWRGLNDQAKVHVRHAWGYTEGFRKGGEQGCNFGVAAERHDGDGEMRGEVRDGEDECADGALGSSIHDRPGKPEGMEWHRAQSTQKYDATDVAPGAAGGGTEVLRAAKGGEEERTTEPRILREQARGKQRTRTEGSRDAAKKWDRARHGRPP